MIDFIRHTAAHTTALDGHSDWSVESKEPDPAAAFERTEMRQAVREVLNDLHEWTSAVNCRLMRLRWLEGCTVTETAARLGLTSRQVTYRDHRLKQTARRLLRLRTAQDRFAASMGENGHAAH
jgi:DNA-directed RNA polymerase specialized sigma24 family protein